MITTRREFIEQIVGASTTIAALSANGLAMAVPSASAPPLEDTGKPDAPTLRILMATAEAVAGMQPLRGHYEAYYRHQAARLPGYLRIYERFANEVRSSTLQSGHEDFAACDLPERFLVLDSIRSKPEAARAFEIPVLQETLAIFAATDAWLALGYVSWEGSPRGLSVYREPFSS